MDRIHAIARRQSLPKLKDLKAALAQALVALEGEDPEIRPPDAMGNPGGLILLKPIPTIIIPDLHARTAYFPALLEWIPPKFSLPVKNLLEAGQLQVVCLGDGFHSESRRWERWTAAFNEYSGSYRKHKAMDGEMNDSLGLMEQVMELKTCFPGHFHFLKGNHENVANEFSAENRPFCKFVSEGAMVADWFNKFMSRRIFQDYYRFEKSLPAFAVGDRFCAAHAEPRRHHPREDLIEASLNRKIIYDLTWTANDEAEAGSVAAYLEEYFPGDSRALMFGGHRPVRGHFNRRAEGRFIQIHNPDLFIAAIVCGMENFSPETNIHVVPTGKT